MVVYLPKNCDFLLRFGKIFLRDVISHFSLEIDSIDSLFFSLPGALVVLLFRNGNLMLPQYFFQLFNPHDLFLQGLLCLFGDPIIRAQFLIEMHVNFIPFI